VRVIIVCIVLLGSLVVAGVIGRKFGINEGSDLAMRTSIENSEYQGFGFGAGFGLGVLSFVLGVVLITWMDMNAIMRMSLGSMAIPFMLAGMVIGSITGKADGFSDVMREKIKTHKALLKQEKKKARADKFRKIIRFWE